MCKVLTLSVVGLWFIALAGCQEEAKPKAAGYNQEPAVEEAEVATGTADQKPEPVEAVSCRSLNIPSYDLVIKGLSDRRCDLCHNENFAWMGIILTRFEHWKIFAEPIRNRIIKNFVTEPLEPDEQKQFLTWMDAGSPRTETDCTNLQ